MTRTLRTTPFVFAAAAPILAGVLLLVVTIARAQQEPAAIADGESDVPARAPLLAGEDDANNPAPTPILPGRPDEPVGNLLGEQFESLGIGIALRPPKGSVAVRRPGTNEFVEFVDKERGWT